MAAMSRFLADYDRGRREGRYLTAKLPSLPFPDGAFDLALCSHMLFTYSDHLTLTFHVAAIRELCRVAREARVFPLLTLDGPPSPHLAPALDALAGAGCSATVRRVGYEFQRGGNEMLAVTARG